MACSQLPLYDTADYGGDNSAVQVPCTTELAQPWLAESTGFTTQDGFLRFSLNHATKTYFSETLGDKARTSCSRRFSSEGNSSILPRALDCIQTLSPSQCQKERRSGTQQNYTLKFQI